MKMMGKRLNSQKKRKYFLPKSTMRLLKKATTLKMDNVFGGKPCKHEAPSNME